jgi:hypothetical protein
VGAHVGEQVVDGPAQHLPIADGDQVGRDVRSPGPRGIGDLGPLDAVVHQDGEIDRIPLPLGMLVEASQPEHVVDQPAHPLCLQLDPAHRLIDLRALGQGALRIELGVGAKRGQRGAQLMAGLGEEAAHQVLTGLAFGDGRRDAAEHPVQRRAEPAHLASGVGGPDPVGEVTGGDAIGSGRHHLDGPQASAHDQADADEDERGGGPRPDDDDEPELADGRVDVPEVDAGDQGARQAGHRDGRDAIWYLSAGAGHGLGLGLHHLADRVAGQRRGPRAALQGHHRPLDGHELDGVLAEDEFVGHNGGPVVFREQLGQLLLGLLER